MEWIILFGISWVLFLVLANFKELKTNLWCGFMAVILQLCVDSFCTSHGLYSIKTPILSFLGSSLFFVFGPIFIIGILLAQYHPKKRTIIVINVLSLAALYSFQEWILLTRKVLVYLNWNFLHSIIINVSALTFLSWFSIIILDKKVGKQK